jgi:hypothetical protein
MEHLEKLIKTLFLEGAVKELAENLNKSVDVDAFSTASGNILLDNNEEVQVQIIVTRKKEDFLGDFEVVEHRTVLK